MEQSILEAEEIVEQLEASAADPDMVNDHVKAAEVYGLLSKAQEKVRVLYARWTELDAIESNS